MWSMTGAEMVVIKSSTLEMNRRVTPILWKDLVSLGGLRCEVDIYQCKKPILTASRCFCSCAVVRLNEEAQI